MQVISASIVSKWDRIMVISRQRPLLWRYELHKNKIFSILHCFLPHQGKRSLQQFVSTTFIRWYVHIAFKNCKHITWITFKNSTHSVQKMSQKSYGKLPRGILCNHWNQVFIHQHSVLLEFTVVVNDWPFPGGKSILHRWLVEIIIYLYQPTQTLVRSLNGAFCDIVKRRLAADCVMWIRNSLVFSISVKSLIWNDNSFLLRWLHKKFHVRTGFCHY